MMLAIQNRPARLLAILSLGGILTATAASAWAEATLASETSEQRGQRIFLGKEAVSAKIGGHDRPLPPQVAACASCHAPASRPSRAERFAPLLTRAWLTEPRPRRGGPAFAYDRQSFCSTIRGGMDPGYVILNRTMPRFELSDAQCGALWNYLSKNPANEK